MLIKQAVFHVKHCLLLRIDCEARWQRWHRWHRWHPLSLLSQRLTDGWKPSSLSFFLSATLQTEQRAPPSLIFSCRLPVRRPRKELKLAQPRLTGPLSKSYRGESHQAPKR